MNLSFTGSLLVLKGPEYEKDNFDTHYIYDTDLSHNFNE